MLVSHGVPFASMPMPAPLSRRSTRRRHLLHGVVGARVHAILVVGREVAAIHIGGDRARPSRPWPLGCRRCSTDRPNIPCTPRPHLLRCKGLHADELVVAHRPIEVAALLANALPPRPCSGHRDAPWPHTFYAATTPRHLAHIRAAAMPCSRTQIHGTAAASAPPPLDPWAPPPDPIVGRSGKMAADRIWAGEERRRRSMGPHG
jgi:hypothetical protein